MAIEPQIGQWEIGEPSLQINAQDSFAWCKLGVMSVTCSLDTTVTFSPETRSFGVILRADSSLDTYYQVRVEPERNRVVFDRSPRPGDESFVIERPLPLSTGDPVRLQVFVDGSIIVAYVNNIALSARGYDHAKGAWGLFVSEGIACFDGMRLTEASM